MKNNTENTFSLHHAVSPMWSISLKQRVKFLLAIKGMTQNSLADSIGINHGTLSKIMSKQWIPTARIKLIMAKKLGVDSLVLFGDSPYFEDYRKTIQVNKEFKK